jgi:endonuclease III
LLFESCILIKESFIDMPKKSFDMDRATKLIAKAIQPYKKAAMFELAEDGFNSTFEQLVACMISIRTYDEVTIPLSRKLFEQARTPDAMCRLSVEDIDALIGQSTFHERKANQIRALAQRVLDEFGGELPCDEETLRSFSGVGPKCAHLVMGIACGEPFISVDIHVHRVTNRWGYVLASTPERTMLALESKLPQQYWVEINRLLVPFGKHICVGSLPHCSTCPISDMCQQVGVLAHR